MSSQNDAALQSLRIFNLKSQICISYYFSFACFLWYCRKVTLNGISGVTPYLLLILFKVKDILFIFTHFPTKLEFFILPIKAEHPFNCTHVMENFFESHCISQGKINKLANEGFREITCLVCNALCTSCHFNYFATLGFPKHR